MKILGRLIGLALIAGSASASIILSDADFSTASMFFDTGSGSFTATDIAGNPGYNFTSSAQATFDVSADPTRAAFVFLDVDIADQPADVWHFEIQNTSTFAAQTILQVVMDGATHVTTVNSGMVNSGATYTFDWDLTVLGTTVNNLQWATAAMGAQNSQVNSISTTVIPEPATLGLFVSFGGVALFIRKKIMI